MKQFKILVVAMLSMVTTANAQNVSFKVLEDDPALMKNLLVYFEPFYGEAWGASRISLGYRLGTHWTLNKRFQAEVQIQKPYNEFFDSAYRNAVTGFAVHNKEYDEFKPTKFINLMGSFTFAQGESYRPVKVVLSSSTSGRFTNTTYISPKAAVHNKFNLRGGLYRYNSTLVFGDGDDGIGDIVTPDGEILHLYGANDAAGNSILYEYNTLNWGTSEKVTCLVGGVSFQSVKNIVINADGYGRCSNSSFFDIYFDMLFAPSPNIENVHYGEHSFDITHGENALETSNLGFRMGYRLVGAKRLLNWGVNSEFGIRPGLKGKGLFLNFGLMLPIVGIKVPKLGLGQK